MTVKAYGNMRHDVEGLWEHAAYATCAKGVKRNFLSHLTHLHDNILLLYHLIPRPQPIKISRVPLSPTHDLQYERVVIIAL